MQTIEFNISRSLDFAWESSMSLLSTILILLDSQIHICPTNNGDVTPNIEVFIDETFSFTTTLNILNVQLDNHYVRLWRHFDNMGSRGYLL